MGVKHLPYVTIDKFGGPGLIKAYPNLRDRYRRIAETHVAAYRKVLGDESAKGILNTLEAEYAWRTREPVTFKLNLEPIEVLTNAKIRVKGSRIVLPYNPFAIRLERPVGDVCSMLVFESLRRNDGGRVLNVHHKQTDKQFGTFVYPFDDDTIVEDAEVIKKASENHLMAFRLAMGVILVASNENPGLREDVCDSLRHEYDSSESDADREYVVNKSRNRSGAREFIIDERALRLAGPRSGENYTTECGKHLKFQHERRAHWMTVWCGKGRKLQRDVLIPQLTVCPHLPRKPIILCEAK